VWRPPPAPKIPKGKFFLLVFMFFFNSSTVFEKGAFFPVQALRSYHKPSTNTNRKFPPPPPSTWGAPNPFLLFLRHPFPGKSWSPTPQPGPVSNFSPHVTPFSTTLALFPCGNSPDGTDFLIQEVDSNFPLPFS